MSPAQTKFHNFCFGTHSFYLFAFLQLGVGMTVYPQRPGQTECDVCILFLIFFFNILFSFWNLGILLMAILQNILCGTFSLTSVWRHFSVAESSGIFLTFLSTDSFHFLLWYIILLTGDILSVLFFYYFFFSLHILVLYEDWRVQVWGKMQVPSPDW